MRYRPVFRSVSNFVAAAAALAMLALLLATIYFTWFELQWTTFFAGILAAAVISIVSRVSHSEWLLARRSAQVVVVIDHQFAQEQIADLIHRKRHRLRFGATAGDVRMEKLERGLFIAVVGEHRVPDLDRDREDFDAIPFDEAPW